jgi:signal transduction histidine kinase
MNVAGWLVLCAALAAVALLLWDRRRLRGPGRTVPSSPSERLDLAELNRDRRRSTEIIERMAEGVLVLNDALTPVLANGAARQLLGLQEVSLPIRLSADEVTGVARTALDSGDGQEEVVRVWFPTSMSLRVRAAPLEDRGVVVVLEDVTQELLTQQIRREFVSSASHELKSPVAGMLALAEALQQAAKDDPETAARFASKLVTETERLARLISDLLDLSRLEESIRAPRERHDLTEIARREIDRLADDSAEAGIELSSDVEPRVLVRGDDHQLGVMIRNLLDNALRYTPAGGTIETKLETIAGEVVLTVTDTGMGIPLEAQDRVFERFYRVDRARSRDMGGTGLGLAIAKHVVELHGGRIGVESELGRGSTFIVRLPAADAGREHIRSVS